MLLGSSTLDVVIGLVFVYLAVSLVCSAVNEIIEMKLKNWSKDLERGICELVAGEGGEKDFDIVQKIYDHPLISGLFQEDYATAKKQAKLPSYIPSRNFALALIDIVKSSVPALSPAPVSAAAVRGGTDGAAVQMAPVQSLRDAAVAFGTTNPKVSKAIVTLLNVAEDDEKRVRQYVEQWFDSSMDRVSGWYKRRTQAIVLAIGLTLAAVANVDSIAIVRTLSTDAGVRDALVAQAKDYASAGKGDGTTAEANLNQSVDRLRHLGLPLGWDKSTSTNDWNGWVMKILGILMTGLAASLGGPFWFDVLNKFVVVRSTVKPTEKSPPEQSKN